MSIRTPADTARRWDKSTHEPEDLCPEEACDGLLLPIPYGHGRFKECDICGAYSPKWRRCQCGQGGIDADGWKRGHRRCLDCGRSL